LASPTYTETNITQHTVWGALTGEPAHRWRCRRSRLRTPALDSRDMQPGDLFVALAGQQTDGHSYIGAALAQGAQAQSSVRSGGWPCARQAGAAWSIARAGAGR
jgi:UDP-N-acetylmuramyl pentapeptide synthase